jgi:hypothetical protein
MAAPVVGAVDQATANAGGAQFSESDLLLRLSPIAIQIRTCRNFAGFIWHRLYQTMQQTSAA